MDGVLEPHVTYRCLISMDLNNGLDIQISSLSVSFKYIVGGIGRISTPSTRHLRGTF